LARGIDMESAFQPATRGRETSVSEDALALLARHGPPALLAALARRRRITARLARAIVARGAPAAIAALMANPGAEIDRETLARALAARPDDDALHAAMIARAELPPEIVQRLGVLVAAARLPQLVHRHAAPNDRRRRRRINQNGARGDPSASLTSVNQPR
jgi:uncharacterized protein (DUF2336 family)